MIWTPEGIEGAISLIRQTRSATAAASALGVSLESLRCALRNRGFSVTKILTGSAPNAHANRVEPVSVAPVAEPVQDSPQVSDSPAWKNYSPHQGWQCPTREDAVSVDEPAGGITKIAIIPDKHVPSHDPKACACARGIIKDFAPDRVIIIGDYMDMESLSHHPKRKPDLVRLSEEYYSANLELDADQDSAPNATWTYLEGNHEAWADKFCAAYGNLDGMLSVPQSLYLEPRGEYKRETTQLRGMNWIPLNRQPLILGELGFLHGVFENVYHAASHAEKLGPSLACKNLIAGHTHDLQSFTSSAGYRAWHCGFLGDLKSIAFSYTKGKPRGWGHGMLLLEVSDNLVTVIQIPIVNGRAILGGKITYSSGGGACAESLE